MTREYRPHLHYHCVVRNPRFDAGGLTLFRTALIKATVGPVMRLMFRTKVEGIENIPGTGAVILAGNHLTFIDSMILPLVCDRTVHFIGKDEYVTGTGLKGRVMAWFFTGSGMIPVDRDGANGGVAALMTGRRILEEGKIFGIYPEGTRSPDGRLYRGRTGIARLTLMTGAPVVPFAMIGTDKLQPGGKGMPRPGRVTLRFGEPMEFSRYEGMDRDRYVLRAVTDSVMAEVMRLSGQEYVDMYATKAKAA
ncbi:MULTISPECIES: lysophospholipid acyltransferase family protein [unclassified Streptomyces]|uniref:lysophospholipid acyltransferase family protein n=1 Tax=unclassified Streptomyces TaxID=2593676 RepID=UPI002271E495|nr:MULTISPECIES: lysophospholipid acyltransferase family protein [unclassified Streptomyces]MCY0919674.1 lysophospholipid acyltransferase family protein [Streptomyces sp. H27-G5]MCY0957074.1 lysophospholipid acyltransferase family protein [Streptomyces sp. H27-H5]